MEETESDSFSIGSRAMALVEGKEETRVGKTRWEPRNRSMHICGDMRGSRWRSPLGNPIIRLGKTELEPYIASNM